MARKPEESQKAVNDAKRLQNTLSAILRELTISSYLRNPAEIERYHDYKRLLRFGWSAYSQCDEDGMLQEIFRRIGTVSQDFLEIGTGDGRVNNTIMLVLQGWHGTWIEGSAPHAELARLRFKDYRNSLVIQTEFVHAGNADQLAVDHCPGGEIDLLSIDIDGNDYWIWKAIESVHPRVVIIEYNAIFQPPLRKVIAYDPRFVWKADTFFGASLSALEQLGKEKGYALVGCSLSGVNAFFVRNDLVADKFSDPSTAENHYEPARYALVDWTGYPPGMGRWVDV